MAQADGTILIDTEIDADGMKADAKRIEKACKNIADTAEEIGESVKKSMTEMADLGRKSDDTGASVDSLSDDLKKTADTVEEFGKSSNSASGDIKKIGDKSEEATDSVGDFGDKTETAVAPIVELGDEAKNATSPIDNLGNKAKDAASPVGDIGGKAQSSASELGSLGTKAKSASSGTDNLKGSVKGASDAVDDLGDSAKGATPEIEGFGDGLDKVSKGINLGNLMEASENLSVVGEKIIDFGKATVGMSSDVQSATSRVNGYFGLTGKAAEEMSGVVENVFKTGLTDSMDEVAESVIVVKNNIKDLNNADLENITEKAILLKNTFGSDMSETMRGASALMTNFGLDASTAMDLLTVGTQNGLDKTQELGDNLSEYSGKFAQAGYSAEEYFQLLQNGLEGGAYNLDKVNDAINEVTTRLADGTIADSIDLYSDKTQTMFEKWKNGGATQKDVIDSIVTDIAGCTNQQEAMNMAAEAFGTMAEDGSIKFIESMTSVGNTYDDVIGKADALNEATTTPMQELQAAVNEAKIALAPLGEKLLELATTILPPIVEGIVTLVEGFLNLPGPVQTAIGVFAGIIALLTTLAPIIMTIVTVVTAFGSGVLLPLIGIIAAVVAVITTVITVITNWGTITEWLSGVWTEFKEFIAGLWNSIKETAVNVFNGIKEFLSGVWKGITTTAQEIWNGIKEFFSSIWEGIKAIFTTTVEAIKSVISKAWNTIKTVTSTVWNGIKSVVSGIWNGLKSGASTAFNAIKNTITNVWNKIKSVTSSIWNGIKNTIRSAINGIIGGINGMIRGVVSGMNAVIRTLNRLNFKIPSWVPGFGGKRFGFSISTISAPQIPYLASGAVIPPNREFMAVLGDQKHGNNIEAPESLIRRIVREESGGGKSRYNVSLMMGRREITKFVLEEGKVIQSQTGRNPFELA